jgi:hypothetical protein
MLKKTFEKYVGEENFHPTFPQHLIKVLMVTLKACMNISHALTCSDRGLKILGGGGGET